MEVHSHTHTPRKKWSHYFWEFLMLFLAVFCGFLAENQREHLVEKHRAKEYAINLYAELKKDTSRLNSLIEKYRFVREKLDTFCLYAREKTPGNITKGMLYYYASFATSLELFSTQSSTIEQLKGSGNMRLMNSETAYAISEYDRRIQELEKDYGLSHIEFEKIETLYFKLFDVYQMLTLFTYPDRKERDSVFRLTNLPIREDPEMMTEFIGLLKFEAHIYLYQVIAFLDPIKKKGEELLALLKRQYHLE